MKDLSIGRDASEAIFSLYYLPSISYFAEFISAEKIVLEKHDNFQKASLRNRTTINTANGIQRLSIPVVGGRDKHQRYEEVKISYATNWQKQHWQSIRSAYGSAPFFEHYAAYIEPFYEKRFELLYVFNLALTEKLLQLLKQTRQLHFTEAFLFPYEEAIDFREYDFPVSAGSTTENVVKSYIQVFAERNGFNPNVSVLDLLFCEGANAGNLLL